MKTLVLAEKPSVGRELARLLGCKQKSPGALIGPNYVVTWALGHLVTLATPEEYNPSWQNWKLENLPMIPKSFDTSIIPKTSKQYGIVKNWLRSSEISKLIIATDAGREGELVARWIIKQAGFKKPIERLWISSMTDTAIISGFKQLKPSRLYDNLYRSAEARSIADWLIGLNVTRALTCKYNAQLSAGRVQTPTLAMIVERENEIRKFIPEDYYQVIMNVNKVRFTYHVNNQQRINQKEKAEKIIDDCKKNTAFVTNVSGIVKHENPPLLYDLTELQRDANRLYGYGAKKTLDIVQKLYEQHKILTYPRTDARYLTTDMESTILARLNNLSFNPFGKIVNEIATKPIKKSKRIFDNSKVSDHHAIIPTEQKPNLNALTLDEKTIYELVVRRFLAVFLDDYEYLQTTIEVNVNNHLFRARGKIVQKQGWRLIDYKEDEDSDDDENQSLPSMQVGNKLLNPIFEIKKNQTKPPARYTEATLLSAMEHPSRFVESKQMKEILERVSGIGTPATRAEIIERLFSVGYMELKGKTIYPTIKGEQLINLVPTKLKSPLLTAQWEQRLTQISEGRENYEDFIKDIEKNTFDLIELINRQQHRYKHDNMTQMKCPDCGKSLLEVKNKQGTMLVCQDRSCGYRKKIIQNSQLRCPNCHKKLTIIGSEEKKYYRCSCGFKERCTSFHDKLNEQRKDLSKNQIQTYLKQQEKEIPKDNPFANFFNK